MKNVYTSWDLDLLAGKMIEKIMENWKSPFSSPAVVFTDPKSEQWFKLRWLKNPAAGKGILMNLKTLRIQQFLFDLVTPEADTFQNTQRLSVELLRDLIITKLTSRAGGKYYFESLGAPEVKAYLTDNSSSSKINANHLYDFAQTIASLFLDYEDTRPDTLKEVLSKQVWQKKLYDDVIGETGIEINGIKYLTLFQLAKKNKEAGSGKLTFNWDSERPVFIFGFSGIGQIYRSILDDFSKTFQLEVFLQLADIPEKPENQLLNKWGKFGREQFGLWTKACSVQALTSDESYCKSDSLLHRTQKAIAENKIFSREQYEAADTSLTLTAAPTRLREIEALHSKLCSLLSQKDGTQLGDILVLAPQIQEYKTAIEQVFDQTDQFAADSDFPYLPYTIADYSGERSLTAEALTILFGILKKGYLSRSDLFSLLHNYLVQTVRCISDEEVSDWADWASKLNIYRDREGHEEWQKAKARLLLARLTTDLVETNDRQFLPFESMTTADSTSLYKFVQVVDELEEWASYSNKEKLEVSDLNRLEELLKNWLLIGDDMTGSLYNESLVFQNVVEEIERQRLTASPDVFADCFANALFDRSAAVTLHSANILTQGITFANFESNRILSAKYIFFIGLDSKAFPGVDSDNELDLRGGKEQSLPGDESIPDRNKNAFLCQLMATREGLFFSYVNKNLQKDEDFFKSSVLGDLFQTVYDPGKDKDGKEKLENTEYEKHIKIDEDRRWQELFTPREFRNKKNYIALQASDGRQASASQAAASASQAAVTTLPDRITIGQMKKFLQDPFVYMVNQKLTNNYDDEEKEALEFEPLILGAKISSELRKEYIKADLKGEDKLSEETLSFDLNNLNALPDSFFGQRAIKTVFENAEKLLEKIKAQALMTSTFSFNENKMLLIKQIPGITSKDWYISGELAWYNGNYKEEKCIVTLELSNSEDVLTGYISSLLLLASLSEDDKDEYSVSLYAGFLDNNNKAFVKLEETYKASAAQARIILNKIYNAMFISQFQKCAPEKLVYEELVSPKNDKPLTFKEFVNQLTSDYGKGNWKYFSKRKLFDPEQDLGYDDDNFDEEWSAAKNQMAELILYISQHIKPAAEEGE